jgi:hypothetical protein
MTTSELLDAIIGRMPKQKDFIHSGEKLRTSEHLEAFVTNNQALLSSIRPSQVADQLLLTSAKFLDMNIGASIAKNVYDEWSVMFMLASLSVTDSKAERNKLMKMFYFVLMNTSKFDMYVKKGARNMKVSADGFVMEFFWLVPLFVNVPVLLSLDISEFIESNEDIAKAVDGYREGYAFYAENFYSMDRTAYKQFLQDGVAELSHSKAA